MKFIRLMDFAREPVQKSVIALSAARWMEGGRSEGVSGGSQKPLGRTWTTSGRLSHFLPFVRRTGRSRILP